MGIYKKKLRTDFPPTQEKLQPAQTKFEWKLDFVHPMDGLPNHKVSHSRNVINGL
jgi:hypothetical protein